MPSELRQLLHSFNKIFVVSYRGFTKIEWIFGEAWNSTQNGSATLQCKNQTVYFLYRALLHANGPTGRRLPVGMGGSPGNRGKRPEDGYFPPPPLISALDAVRDKCISPLEIDQATNHLRVLDKKNDGPITGGEMPPLE